MEIQGRKIPKDILERGYELIPIPDGCIEVDIDHAKRNLYMLGMMDERLFQHKKILKRVGEKLKNRILFPDSFERVRNALNKEVNENDKK